MFSLPVKIIVDQISKSFNDKVIFKNVSFTVNSHEPLAVIGKNGSGKSTLLKCLSGILLPDSGTVKFTENDIPSAPHITSTLTAFCAPYTELIEEFNVSEMLHFHTNFVKPLSGFSLSDIITILDFSKHIHVPLKDFSSGMMQKLKIGLCILFSQPVLIFDEPCTNLDNSAVTLYKQLLKDYVYDRLLIIASNNHPDEIFNCTQTINIEAFK